RRLNRGANLLVRAAPANVSRHSFVDVRVAGLVISLEERRGLHHLPGLAVPALRNIEPHPRLLDWMETAVPEAFDGDNLARGRRAHRRYTRPDCLAALVYGASTAKGHAATELGSH